METSYAHRIDNSEKTFRQHAITFLNIILPLVTSEFSFNDFSQHINTHFTFASPLIFVIQILKTISFINSTFTIYLTFYFLQNNFEDIEISNSCIYSKLRSHLKTTVFKIICIFSLQMRSSVKDMFDCS